MSRPDDGKGGNGNGSDGVAAPFVAVVTRPAGQAAALVAELAAHGISVLEFPLIDILPVADPAPLDAALASLDRYALAIFVSPNALDSAFSRLHAPWPPGLPIAVIGPGSVAALARHGVSAATHRVIAPAGAEAASSDETGFADEESGAPDARRMVASDSFLPPVRYDSEALLDAIRAAPSIGPLAGATILLVRGNGGREALADGLRAAGATVEPVQAYQRDVPSPKPGQWDAIRALLSERRVHAWLLTSSEGVRNLDRLAHDNLRDTELAALKHAQVVTPHARIAESARAAGFDSITTCGAGDANIVGALIAAHNAASATRDATSNVARDATRGAPLPPAHNPVAAQPSASMTDATAPISPESTKAPPPASGAGTPPARGPRGAAPAQPRRRGLIVLWIVVVALAGGGVAGGYLLNQRFDRAMRTMATREQGSDAQLAEARVVSQQALDATRQMQTQLGALSGKLSDSQNQQQALENLYQDLARNREDWTLAEIEQMLTTASQQLQLTGNVPLALFALQSADARLATADGPQMIVVRRAIEKDIDKLKSTPTVDLPGLAIKLDSAIAQVDTLPLLGEFESPPGAQQASPAGASAPSAAAAARPVWRVWWDDIRQGAWQTLHELVQVRRIDNPNAMLVAPDQGYYLRANLKLRLLSARLALLARDQTTMRSDLQAAHDALARYFDPSSKSVQTVSALVDQVSQAEPGVPLPDLSTSLQALRQYKSRS